MTKARLLSFVSILFGAILPLFTLIPFLALFLAFSWVLSIRKDPAVWFMAALLVILCFSIASQFFHKRIKERNIIQSVYYFVSVIFLIFFAGYTVYALYQYGQWRFVFQVPVSVAFRNILNREEGWFLSFVFGAWFLIHLKRWRCFK